MKKPPREYAPKRGAAFVLGLGTRVIKDKKKEQSRNACRKTGDFSL